MSSVWDDVVGQAKVIEQLEAAAERGPTHAYLFVGPPGSTKDRAARAFAARLLAGTDDPDDRAAQLALRGEHPDVREVRRVGPRITFDQAREIVRLSSFAPTEGDRKILILDEFHLVSPEGAALLLKSIEEPQPSTMFIVLADFVPNELITISSRCVRLEFRPIAADVIAARLLTEGVGPADAQAAAHAAGGDLDRARLLAVDPELAARRATFADVPRRLDGTGTVAMASAAELLELIERAAVPLVERHESEAAAVQERIERHGERGSGRKQLEDRHKRELRRHRTDELRAGLATMARTYRDALVAGTTPDADGVADAVSTIHAALESLDRNPNERLLLENLLWSLPPVA